MKENEEEEQEEEEDVEKALAREVKEMKDSRHSTKRRFQSVHSGANNVIFIKTNLLDDKDPSELIHYILTDIIQTGCRKTRYEKN